jgi:acyl transferase domain-containing protein/NAD(P)-dependent dehydrogenase (short-subunit alcohol dehydrogenase family)
MKSEQDIAVVGVGCRFPGNVVDLQTYAELLYSGVDAISEIPDSRWSKQKFYSSKIVRGKSRSKWGGFINNPYHFDAAFFGLTPREVMSMDPQQRVLLEIFWESLEDANISERDIRGSRTGVYIGAFTVDHMLNETSHTNWELIDSYSATGSMMTLLANRISYLFDLTGPSVVVDTACSSSLVAVHLAAQGINSGDCERAVVGGISLMLNPAMYVAESKASMLSPTGRSKSFDELADGYVRGEGAGMVVLKKLQDAINDKDHIYAVIKSTAVNQDGKSSGQTVPNGFAQEQLMKIALERAGISAAELDYIEAHGTGTPVGDPIEANALGNVIAETRASNEYCYIGSVKANFGHTEAAAGVASLIKVITCMKYNKLPKLLHFQKANPNINFEVLKLKPVLNNVDWPRREKPRYVGINSFGFGGTNCHIVLSDYYMNSSAKSAVVQNNERSDEALFLPVSAKSQNALYQAVSNLKELINSGQYPIKLICANAALLRTHHEIRKLFVGNATTLIEDIQKFLDSHPEKPMEKIKFSKNTAVRSTLVLSGMGPQWWGMGRGLLEKEPVFKDFFERCHRIFSSLTNEFSLYQEFTCHEASSRMSETQVAQPANFALQVALGELYRSKGIVFDLIVGHSLGEVAAAYLSGALSLEDAAKVIYYRSSLQQTLSGTGAMLAVGLSHELAIDLIDSYEGKVSIAAINSYDAVTLAGPEIELRKVVDSLESQGIFNKFLKVDVPYHSAMMDCIKEDFLKGVASITPQKNHTPLFSTVTGMEIDGADLEPTYWWRNLREPVYFMRAIESLLDQGANLFFELGPHPVLINSINGILKKKQKEALVIHTLMRNEGQLELFYSSICNLYAQGFDIEWLPIYPVFDKSLSLPKYPWQKVEYKNDSYLSKKWLFDFKESPLLGYRQDSPNPTWMVTISDSDLAYLVEHKVQRQALFPAAGYVEMVLQAAHEVFGSAKIKIHNLEILKALFIENDDSDIRLQFCLDLEHNTFNVYSFTNMDEAKWEHNAKGEIYFAQNQKEDMQFSKAYYMSDQIARMDKAQIYEYFQEIGFQYGLPFQLIHTYFKLDMETAIGLLEVPDIGLEKGYYIHPTILDAGLQVLLKLSVTNNQYLPTKISDVHIYGVAQRNMTVLAKVIEQDEQIIKGEIKIFDEQNNMVIHVKEVVAENLEKRNTDVIKKDWFNQVIWEESKNVFVRNDEIAKILFFADQSGVAEKLSVKLEKEGYEIILVYAGESFEVIAHNRVVIPVGDAEAQVKLLSMFTKLSVVVWLWSLDSLIEIESVESLRDCHQYGINSILTYLKVSEKLNSTNKFWLVTRGMVHAADAKINLSQAHLLGFSRVMAYQEAIQQWCGYIDLDPNAFEDEVDLLKLEITSKLQSPKQEIAYRNGRRLVARLESYPMNIQQLKTKYSKYQSYLITGGLGDLGYLIAEHLVKNGAQHIILQIRSPLPERSLWSGSKLNSDLGQKIKKVQALEKMGASIYIVTTDITCIESIKKMSFEHTRKGLPPIKNVIHCAGVVKDTLAINMNIEDVELLFKTKIYGSWALHKAFGEELETFILFSSYASIYGAMGQSNYAAANGFMDALAHYRHQQGMKCISINFGPWSGLGMAARLLLGNYFEQQGIHQITRRSGLKVFDMLFHHHAPEIVVAPTNWDLLGKLYTSGVPDLFHNYVSQGAPGIEEFDESFNIKDIAGAIKNASSEDKVFLVQEFLRRSLADITKIDYAEINMNDGINSFGIDSIMSIDFRNRIEAVLSSKLNLVDLLKGPNLVQLSAIVLESL